MLGVGVGVVDRDGTSPSLGVLACPWPWLWLAERCTSSSSSGSRPNNAAFSAIISASEVIPLSRPPPPSRVKRLLVEEGLVVAAEPGRPFFSATPEKCVSAPGSFYQAAAVEGDLPAAARKNFLRLISLRPDINVNVARVWKSLCDRRMAYTRFGFAFSW